MLFRSLTCSLSSKHLTIPPAPPVHLSTHAQLFLHHRDYDTQVLFPSPPTVATTLVVHSALLPVSASTSGHLSAFLLPPTASSHEFAAPPREKHSIQREVSQSPAESPRPESPMQAPSASSIGGGSSTSSPSHITTNTDAGDDKGAHLEQQTTIHLPTVTDHARYAHPVHTRPRSHPQHPGLTAPTSESD